MTLFWQKNITQDRKWFITQSKHMIFWLNKKFLKADNLLLLFLQKKLFFILSVAHTDLFFVQIGPKKQFLWDFTNFFSELMDCNTSYNINWIPTHISLEISWKKVKWVWSLEQNLGQIRSNFGGEKQRNWHYPWAFFKFCMRHTFKSKK